MTRAEVIELLELRRLQTGEPFDSAGVKVDAWWDILADYDTHQVMTRYRELIRSGAGKVAVPQLVGGLQRNRNALPAQHDCTHDRARPDGRLEWRCPDCDAQLLAAEHPRARAAFERGLAQARAERERRTAELFTSEG